MLPFVVLSWTLCCVHALSILKYLPYSTSFSQYYVDLKQAFLTSSESIEREDFDVWLVEQKDIAFKNILNNIGGLSPTLDDSIVPPGVVLASPSQDHPNYYYQWVRDLALTIRSLIYELADKDMVNKDLSEAIESYIVNNYHLQRTPNLSGSFDDDLSGIFAGDLEGLGEPKFHPNLSAFNENWGRPQRDGPGLRVLTIAVYLGFLEKYGLDPHHRDLPSKEFIYQHIIKPDLKYIIRSWSKAGFDLWEEDNGLHFFTLITQLRALIDGKSLYHKYDRFDSTKDAQFALELEDAITKLRQFIQQDAGYITPGFSHIIENPGLLREGKRGGLDTATFLGSLHSHSMETSELIDRYADLPFDIDSAPILNSLAAMVTDMKIRYPVNRFKTGYGVALGRYPEDIYDGYGTTEGNPWFISTVSASEIIYRLIYKLNTNSLDLVIDDSNRDFFSHIIDLSNDNNNNNSDNGSGTLRLVYGSTEYNTVMLNLLEYADLFMAIVKDHVDDLGRMSEQFNRYNGFMQGARDLTWSYSAVWNGIRWRQRVLEVIL